MRISGDERYIWHLSDVSVSRNLNKTVWKLYQSPKRIYIRFCIKVVILNRLFSTNTKPIWKRRYPPETWEFQVCSCYNYFIFICIFNRYNWKYYYIWYYVTRNSANGSSVYWSRDTDCTAIGWISGDVIRTICNNIINFIY